MARYSPGAIANHFLELSGRDQNPLTPMQLLKLVYISHGWHLATTGEPLFDECVEAWKYGPVIPSLFHEFKRFGGSAITELAFVPVSKSSVEGYPELSFDSEAPFINKKDEKTKQLLEWVWRSYGKKDGWELSRLTHLPDTPWSQAVEAMRRSAPAGVWTPAYTIDNESIRKHYVDLWAKRHGGA